MSGITPYSKQLLQNFSWFFHPTDVFFNPPTTSTPRPYSSAEKSASSSLQNTDTTTS